jgi:probable rRNA maturation factor
MSLDVYVETAGQGLGTLPISDTEWQQWFAQWWSVMQPQLPPPYQADEVEVSLRLTDDADIQQLNACYRQIDQPTDVLAFAALESELPWPAEEVLPLGDIVISVPTAQRQAADHGLRRELAWLSAHGFLHLLGWDHPDADQLNRMLSQQAILLRSVGIEPPDWQSCAI